MVSEIYQVYGIKYFEDFELLMAELNLEKMLVFNKLFRSAWYPSVIKVTMVGIALNSLTKVSELYAHFRFMLFVDLISTFDPLCHWRFVYIYLISHLHKCVFVFGIVESCI